MQIKIVIKTKLGSTKPMLFDNRDDAEKFLHILNNTIENGNEMVLTIEGVQQKVSSLDFQSTEIIY